MRLRRPEEDESGVPLSPLIDCVFLLLIFFLVTTMFKKFEKQIPVTLPDASSSLRAEANDDAYVIGLDAEGRASVTTGKRNMYGRPEFQPIDDIAAHLQEVAGERGISTRIRLQADRMTPFQKVIDAIDIAKIQGFENVETRTLQRKE